MKKSKFKFDTVTIAVLSISFLLIIIIFVAIITSSKDFGDKKQESETQQKTVSFPSVSVPDDVFANYECEHDLTDYTDSYIENGEELIYSYASYPVISSKNAAAIDVINNSILQFVTERSSVKEHEKILALEKFERASNNAEGFIQFEFILKCESVTVKEKFISILFSYSRTVSMSEPSYEYYSLNYDLKSGRSVNFSDIIGTDTDGATDYISSIISQDINNNPNMYYPNALEDLEYCIDTSSFFLSDKGAVIYFNPESLTPGVYGIRTFLIPYEKIGY